MNTGNPIALTVLLSLTALNLAAQPSSSRTPSFGTTSSSYYALVPSDFNPTDSATTFTAGDFLTTNQGGAEFIAPLHLPSGALLTYFAFYYCDSGPDPGGRLHVVVGDHSVDGTSTPLAGLQSTASQPCGSIVEVDVSGLGYTVENATHSPVVDVTLNGSDMTNKLSAVVIGFKLQVSSAPEAPTFADVPVAHPFFQFVEALASAGITGGCGGGNYCPDTAVTRGQMAVFLSKALGLNWPQ
jgi:hypothetical protein